MTSSLVIAGDEGSQSRRRLTTEELQLGPGDGKLEPHVGLLTLAVDGTIIEANRAVAHLIGVDAAAMVGRKLDELIGFDDPGLLGRHLATCLDERSAVASDMRCRVGGAWHVFEVLSVPVLIGDHWVTSSACRDTSARSRREAGLALLAELGDRLGGAHEPRALAAALAGTLAPAFVDACLVYWDTPQGARACTPLAVATSAPTAAPTEPETELVLAVRDTLESGVGRRIGTAAQTASIVPLVDDRRTRGVLVLLEARPARAGSATWRAHAGEIARRAAVALAAASRHAEATRALAHRDALLAMLSHDLRNAIGSASMNCQLLERQPEHAPETWSARTRRLEGIHRAVTWMNELVEDLLDKHAITQGQLALDRELFDAGDLCREAAALHQAQAAARAISIVVEDTPGTRVLTDHCRTIQVLDNLLANAVAVSHDGARVQVRVERQGADMLRVSVHDAGPGLELQGTDVEQVFRAAVREPSNARGRGRGLGLPIAQTLVRALGGRLWVEHGEPTGSVFCFTLPAGEAQ